LILRKPSGGSLMLPLLTRQSVVVERHSAHQRSVVTEASGDERLGPGGILIVSATGDDLGSGAGWRVEEGLVLAKQVEVVVRRHVATAAPGFITNRQISDLPR